MASTTTYDQVANTPSDHDEPFCNYHATQDLTAGIVVSLDTTNYVGASGAKYNEGVIVYALTGTTPAAYPVGVTMETVKAAGVTPGRVRTGGVAVCTASAAITQGAWVTGTANGQVVTASSTYPALGQAITASSASGDPIRVRIMPVPYYHAAGS